MSGDILLCDLDAFFAAVEQLEHPEYRGKPVIVGGRPGERGVVATCSYEARKYGVHSAMPMVQAAKLCPDAVFLPVNMDRYRQVSARVFAVYERFAAKIEKVSIDEAYLAVPAGLGVETASKIREAVRREHGLPVSVGVSVNKLLAKMACELAKPDGLYQVAKEDVPKIIWPLPVNKLHGVGPQTQKKLNRIGIKTIGQLAKLPEDELIKMFGAAFGVLLHQRANGIDIREIEAEREIKSIGEETTFPKDVYDRDAVLITLMDLAGQVGYRLRHKGLKARSPKYWLMCPKIPLGILTALVGGPFFVYRLMGRASYTGIFSSPSPVNRTFLDKSHIWFNSRGYYHSESNSKKGEL